MQFWTVLAMVHGGSETIDIAFGAIFYYLLHEPEKMKKLCGEIDTLFPSTHKEGKPGFFESFTLMRVSKKHFAFILH